MSIELQKQSHFWDTEIQSFDAIYTHRKSYINTLMDKVFRKDMYQRFEFTINHSDPIEGRTFLDVGCGTALYSVEFARKGAEIQKRHTTKRQVVSSFFPVYSLPIYHKPISWATQFS